MARPPLALGHHGTITTKREDGRWVSRCRVRDFDGVTRRCARWGATKAAAQAALQDELRTRHGDRPETLRPNSRFRDAAGVWLAKTKERREDSTVGTYEHWLNRVVLPGLGELRLAECDVAILDAWFGRLARERKTVAQADGSTTEKPLYAANSRRTIRTIVSGILQQAVLHKAIPSNPIRELERIESPRGHKPAPPRGLTVEERRRLLDYVDNDPVSIAADLPDIIRFALGTGLRIGEICAVRWMDINISGLRVFSDGDIRLVPVVAVRQNVYPVRGKGLVVHGGKTALALRIVPLPAFVVRRLRDRKTSDTTPELPVFAAAARDSNLTYRWPSTLRRSVRAVRTATDLDWMTPHTWRRTYATLLDDELGLSERAKADLLGQSKFLRDTYVSRGELHPDAAVCLDRAFEG